MGGVGVINTVDEFTLQLAAALVSLACVFRAGGEGEGCREIEVKADCKQSVPCGLLSWMP